MANGMRKLLWYMKEHPPKNVELQRINVLEAENARLREALKRIAFGNFQWRNKMVEIAIAALAGPEKPIRANFPPFDHRNLGKRGGIE